jgi:hypothetical protein
LSQSEIALVNLNTWHSFRSISSTNSELRYSNDNGATWHYILISKGSYELNKLNDEIEKQMKQNNHYDKVHNQSYIKLSPNISRLRTVTEVSGSCQVDFREPNSIITLLGFNRQANHTGFNESENIVDIVALTSIFVEIDIINGSYVNGELKPVIYSLFLSVAPGYKIVES